MIRNNHLLRSVAILALFLLSTLFFTQSSLGLIVEAREIEATYEWQLIGENDTLPAGLHIRMDMTTGEKWAKLPDDNEDSSMDVSVDGSDTSSSDETARLSTTTSLAMVPDDAANDSGQSDEKEEIPDFDYEMMHRTLSQLPPEEQARVGGIPELPGSGGITSLTPKQRELFELRMRQIWEHRQEELRRIEEEQVADLPQILKDRIVRIRKYLKDPEMHFLEPNRAMLLNDKKNDNDKIEDDDDYDEPTLETIVDVLADLEFLLTDLDMARDFYTLGGWPLLVSLVSEDLHYPTNDGTATTVSVLQQEFTQKVQSHAVWALGTAVKNTGEFSPWITEVVSFGKNQQTTALDLVQLAYESSFAASSSLSSLPALQQKLIYALGSFLRGNLQAQVHFANANGPMLLARSLERLEGEACQSSFGGGASHCAKMMQRVLSLASDVVLHVQQQQQQSATATETETTLSSALKLVAESFVDSSWCTSILGALEKSGSSTSSSSSLQRAALHAIPAFAEQCQWRGEEAAKPLQSALKSLKGQWQGDDSYQEELELVQQLQMVK